MSKLRRGIIAAAPAPSCTVNLDDDGSIASNAGLNPMDNVSTANQICSTDSTETQDGTTEFFTLSWTGWREIEVEPTELLSSNSVQVGVQEFSGGSPVGQVCQVNELDYAQGDRITVRAKGDGSFEILVNGSLATSGTAGNAGNDFIINVSNGDDKATYEWYAAAADQLHSTTNDWCGNTI